MSKSVLKVDPEEFQLVARSVGKVGRKRLLTPAQGRYVRKAGKLRRQLTNKALARRLGVATRTIRNYLSGHHKV